MAERTLQKERNGTMTKDKRIAVLGAGTMGAGMAATYAAYGFPVSLYSRREETLQRARQVIRNAVQLFAEEGLISSDEAEVALSNISCTTSLEQAVSGAWYVAETIAEKRDAKEALYEALDNMLPEGVIIASNTSYMDIFSFMPARRQSCSIIAHWVAPPHIIPLVEIVKGPRTEESVVSRTMDLHLRCQKTPVRIEKYIPGFILNRLQSAMTREVLHLLDGGYCSPETIDLVAKSSLMPRGMLLGVVQRMDFTGLDTVVNGLKNASYTPAAAPGADSAIFRLVEDGDYGAKSGRGFYDYSGSDPLETLDLRDRQLLRSIRLARAFLEEPLGAPRDDLDGE